MQNKDFFIQYVLEQYPLEACGYIVDNTFIPIENISETPHETFKMSEEDSKRYLDQDFKVIHSHTMAHWDIGRDPRAPSEQDMQCQENLDVPFGIVHTDGENVTDILWFGTDEIPDLIGREYISNVLDCFTLARDYFKLNYDIDFGTHPRPIDWESWNPHYIEMHYKDLGFIDVPLKNDIQIGDVVLFSIGSRYINHIGVYIGDDKFIHHLFNRKSCEDKLSRWQRQWTKTIRLENDRKEA